MSSGTLMAYGGTIFNHLLANPGSEGVVAVIVYPMNALINSQTNELSTLKRKPYEERPPSISLHLRPIHGSRE